jgi:hypothetical protein
VAVVQRDLEGGVMALWCRDFPTVTVPKDETPKRLTLVVPFYQCQRFFERQLRGWLSYPAELLAHLSVIVVDDGSPEPVRLPSWVGAVPKSMLSFLRLFRIEVDVMWNWLAARNIGAHHAEDGWLLLTDMDHVVPEQTLRAVLFGQHDPKVVYAFSRREHTGEVIAPHSASFLMTREMFWTIGGYDETLSGVYGTDGLYRKRVAAAANIQILTDELTRYEYVEDSSTRQFPRKTAEMGDAKRRKLRNVGPTPKVLSFPYHEVTA